jgi:hypothetical protein
MSRRELTRVKRSARRPLLNPGPPIRMLTSHFVVRHACMAESYFRAVLAWLERNGYGRLATRNGVDDRRRQIKARNAKEKRKAD